MSLEGNDATYNTFCLFPRTECVPNNCRVKMSVRIQWKLANSRTAKDLTGDSPQANPWAGFFVKPSQTSMFFLPGYKSFHPSISIKKKPRRQTTCGPHTWINTNDAQPVVLGAKKAKTASKHTEKISAGVIFSLTSFCFTCVRKTVGNRRNKSSLDDNYYVWSWKCLGR